MADPAKTLDFLAFISRLKRLKRTGWWENGVKEAEHVSAHMHRMAVFCLLNRDPAVDTDRLVRVAIMHDVSEALVGDLSPKQMKEQGVTKEQKLQMETEAMRRIADSIGDKALAEELFQTWKEYEDQETVESHWIKDIDRLEMAIQAFEYEKAQHVHLPTFYRGVPDAIKHPWLRSVAAELMRQRTQLAESVPLEARPALPLDETPQVPYRSIAGAAAAGVIVGVVLAKVLRL